MINFITLKWGNKYGPEYVNRLHNSIKHNYTGKFNFVCLTDNPKDLNCDTEDINKLSLHNNSQVFTSSKLDLYKQYKSGKYCLLDLDVLILKDLKPYFDQYNFLEPRFILNRWQDYSRIYTSYFTNDCFVNSSFVTWKDNQLGWLYDNFIKYKELVEFRYKSVDKYIFYSSFEKLFYHPPKMVYAYSFGAEFDSDMDKFKYRPEYNIVLFHTSHKKPKGVELHEANDWAKKLWEKYD